MKSILKNKSRRRPTRNRSLFLIFAVCVMTFRPTFASPTPALGQARNQFQAADALLNKTYKRIRAELTMAQILALRDLQRDWVQYRDSKSKDMIVFDSENRVLPDKPKDVPEYWNSMTSLTQERIEFLRVYSGAAVPKGISGKYSDFYGGDLRLTETKNRIAFYCDVIRRPNAHTGEISGVARREGDEAIYKEVLSPGDDGKTDRSP